MAAKVIGGADHHAPVAGELHAHQAGVRQIGDSDGDIDAFADQIDHAIIQVQGHVHVAMLSDEGGNQRRHDLPSETGGRGNAQMATRSRAALRGLRLGIFEIVQDALAVFEERQPFIGQRYLARRPLQQFHPQACLERIEPPANHRRSHALGARRRRQAAARCDIHESGDLFELIHREEAGRTAGAVDYL